MREAVENLVQAIANGDALETEKAFATAMAEKLAPMLDARRIEVSQSMFASQQETVSEEVKTDDEEDEDKNKDDEDSEEDKEDKEKDGEDKQEMKEGAYTNPGLEALLAKKRAEKAAATTGKKMG